MTMIHVDILDGHFSPSMPLGLDTVKQIAKRTGLELEAHVMVKDPQFFVDELIEAGVSQIVFHLETCDHVDGMLNYIHSKGIRAGVALKPATPLYELEYILEKCDAVLLMLINPGFAQMKGEAQTAYSARKIHDLHEMIQGQRAGYEGDSRRTYFAGEHPRPTECRARPISLWREAPASAGKTRTAA